MPPVREDIRRVVLDYRNTTTTIERTLRGRIAVPNCRQTVAETCLGDVHKVGQPYGTGQGSA